MEQLPALVVFSFASCVTPGPNNIMLWATGASFGFRRTVPHILGTAVGIALMTIGVAVGSGAVVAAIPGLATAMKVGGSLYLLFLAYRIARAGALERPVVAHPFGLVAASAFQLINPKAWLFALAAVTTFRPVHLPAVIGTALLVVTMTVIVVPTAALWAGAGDAIGRLTSGSTARRLVSVALAVLLVGSVGLVWV